MKGLIKLIKKAKKIALFSHTNPDPDTIGSVLALGLGLEKIGKDVSLFCDTDDGEKYAFLGYYDRYNTNDIDENFDLMIAVDVPTIEKLGKFAEKFLSHDNNAKLDHHKTCEDYAKLNIMIPYSACAILVYELLKKLKVKIDSDIATFLYFAICGDTGLFKYNNTDSKTFLVASKLLEFGARIRDVYENFFDKFSVPDVMLKAKVTLDAKLYDELGYAIMIVKRSDFEKYGVKNGNMLRNLPHTFLNCGYKMAAILREEDDGIHCSLRSKFEYDCNEVAVKFGGGGHKNAAGLTIQKPINEACKMIELEIKKYLSQMEEKINVN